MRASGLHSVLTGTPTAGAGSADCYLTRDAHIVSFPGFDYCCAENVERRQEEMHRQISRGGVRVGGGGGDISPYTKSG